MPKKILSRLSCLSRLLPVVACVLALACTDDSAPADGDTGEENPEPHVILTVDFDATTVCGPMTERVEFATRRVNCFDPELPCTTPSSPPWITGTGADCSDITGGMTWEVEVTQTGSYESQIRGLAGGVQEGLNCFAAGGEARTNVANADLDGQATFVLTPTDDSNCSNP